MGAFASGRSRTGSVRPEVSKGSLDLAVGGVGSESPQAPSALHPEFLLSWQKEPKPRPRLQRPFGVPCAARKPRPDSNSLHSLRSLRSNSESESEVVAGLRPRLVLLCCSALQDGATPKQPAANSRETARWWKSGAVGCWYSAASAICTPPKRTATRGLAKQASTTSPDSLFERSEQSERSEFESAPGCEHCREPRRGGVSWRSAFPPFWQDKRGSGCRGEAPCGLSLQHATQAHAHQTQPNRNTPCS
jgi:hypothetical protein